MSPVDADTETCKSLDLKKQLLVTDNNFNAKSQQKIKRNLQQRTDNPKKETYNRSETN